MPSVSLSKFRIMALSFLVVAAGAVFPVHAEEFSAAQKEAVEKIINEYLMNHPEVVVQAIEKYQSRALEEAEEKSKRIIKEKMSVLTAKDQPSIGKMGAPVTVIEFFDYNCGYCKRALVDIQEIVKEHDKVRFVFMEMPILGSSSTLAASYALAAHEQNRYFDFHAAIMMDRGAKDSETLERIGKELGLDVEKLKKDAQSEKVKQKIAQSMQIAQETGIQGTPAFIVNGELFRGYMGKAALLEEIKKAAEPAKDKSDKKG